MNILAYADDVLLAPSSRRGLQCLLNLIGNVAANIDMSFNITKTVCMIFNACVKCKTVSDSFPQFSIAGNNLSLFLHLRQIVDNKLQYGVDVCREPQCLFTRPKFLYVDYREAR